VVAREGLQVMQCTLLLENLCVQTQRRVTYRERGDGQYQTLTLTRLLTRSLTHTYLKILPHNRTRFPCHSLRVVRCPCQGRSEDRH
jgi:hypothetical protein